jgi:hypothetical protein
MNFGATFCWLDELIIYFAHILYAHISLQQEVDEL